MKRFYLHLILLAVGCLLGCRKEKLTYFPSNDHRLSWQGRTWQDDTGNRYLIGSASSLKFSFYGSQCRIWMQNAAPANDYNYISLIIDGERQPRKAIDFDTLTPLGILAEGQDKIHVLELYKETEAACGAVIISAVEADSIRLLPPSGKKKIAFIGNSITVGMSSDESLVPCETGKWYDQHNAYDAFGPVAARALDMDYEVIGFSGIGIYRNTRADRPVMQDIYASAFLSPDPNSPRWDFNQFIPDVVSICLGTNDFSDGDGVTPRAPFDPAQFIPAYVDFINTVHGYHRNARIIITNTPMLDGRKNAILVDCLQQIKTQAEASIPGLKPLYVFSFGGVYQSGCFGHPDVTEQGKMAEEMILFLKGVEF